MKNDNRVCLGKIVGVHGIKGNLKIKSFTDFEEDLGEYGIVEDKSGTRKFELETLSFSKGTIRVRIKGIDDRNKAEELRGTELYVSREVLEELEEDEFYHADLIGLDVKLASSGDIVGEVVRLHDFGAGDIIEIKLNETGTTEMLPFTKEYVPVIDIKNKFVVVKQTALEFDAEIKEEVCED